MTKLLCNKAVSGLRKRINAAIIDEDEEIEEIDENEGSDEDNERLAHYIESIFATRVPE